MKKILLILLPTLMFLSSCASDKKNTMAGAGIGAVAGGAIGAVLGKGKGAAIGAALGGTVGGLIGHRMDKQAKELEAIAETKRTEQGLVTKLKSDILFDSGKSQLKGSAKTNLTQMAEIMKKYPENVLTIKGYTDNTGKVETNNKLSNERAEAVRRELVAAGMPANVISTVGMGPENPIADNNNAEGRKQNRRVEIEITVDESKVPADKKG